jgi:hypothetical protein
MRFTRTSIAAAATIAALGILAAVALASGGEPTTTAPAPAADTDPPAQVRTETVRRTVHRDAPAVRSASTDDDGTADQGPGDAPRTPVAPAHDANDDRGHDINDDHGGNSGPGSSSRGGGDDGPNHDLGDDHGGDRHGGDDHGGGGHSGHGGGGDDD